MMKLDNLSVEVFPECIDLFNSKPTLVGLEHSSLVEYPTTHPITDGPIRFHLNTGSCFVDFSKSFLVTTFRILRKEGTEFVNIDKTDPVSFINGFGGTFIRNFKVLFNSRQVYNEDLYAYNAYMRRRLNIDGKNKQNDLQSAGYFEDELSQMSGPGFEARRALYTDGRTFKTACSLDVGIFKQKKLLLNDLVVDIEIMPNTNTFTILSTGTKEYKYEVLDCKLMVKQYSLNMDLNNSIQDNLNKGAIAKYNYTRNIMRYFYISPGTYDFEAIMFRDQLPKRLFLGLVNAKAFHGHIGMSPFDFAPNGLQSIQVKANGISLPTAPYKLDWKANSYVHPYMDLSNSTEHGISLQKYAAHSAFYCFDLQLQNDGDLTEAQKGGTTDVSLTFTTAVPDDGLQLVVYAEFDSILGIDNTRHIISAVSL